MFEFLIKNTITFLIRANFKCLKNEMLKNSFGGDFSAWARLLEVLIILV